jgi:glycosyltransferase involved in cell wall biosynthesis
MKIVQVLNSLTVGGIEKVVVDICNTFDSKENNIFIITLSDQDLTLKPKLNKNVEVICLPFKNDSILGLLSFWLFGIPKLIKIINKIKPDIVHSHLYYHYLLFLSISLKFSRIKPTSFRTVHTSGLFYSSKSLLNIFRCKVEKFALSIYPTRLVSISKNVFNNNDRLFSKVAFENRFIPNGINMKRFSKSNYQDIKKNDFGIQEDCMVVSYVSRLDKGKNHICLLNSWVKVIDKFPNSILCLVGDGVLKNELKEYVKLLGLEQKVSFLGTIDNVASLLCITDIAVFPSQFEGFPISLIEKLAMGLPVITSDIDVFKEVIIENENGFICKVNNSDDYADKMILLLGNEELRNYIGKNAIQTSKKYDIERIVNETIHFYEEALPI